MMNFIQGLINGTYWGRKTSRFKDQSDLKSWQQVMLKKQMSAVRQKSPYYRSISPEDDLCRFPLMDKSTLMNHFDQINISGLQRDLVMEIAKRAEQERNFSAEINGITVGRSTGTSGSHGIFAVNQYESGFWAGYILRRMLPHGVFSKERIALALRSGSNLYQTVNRGRIRFKYLDIALPLKQWLRSLADYQPTVIVATPAVLRILADHQHYLKLLPRMLISAADVLEDSDRKVLESAFHLPISQIYQATEGLLGLTCEHGSMHLCEDLVFFEFENQSEGRVSPIITDLRRQTLPLVRYKLNDLLKTSPVPCACGSPLQRVERIEGRQDQVLYGVNLTQDKLIPIFPDYIRRIIAETFEDLGFHGEYRVRQKSPKELSISISGDFEYKASELIAAKLKSLYQSHDCIAPNTNFTSLENICLTKKRRRIGRDFPLTLETL